VDPDAPLPEWRAAQRLGWLETSDLWALANSPARSPSPARVAPAIAGTDRELADAEPSTNSRFCAVIVTVRSSQNAITRSDGCPACPMAWIGLTSASVRKAVWHLLAAQTHVISCDLLRQYNTCARLEAGNRLEALPSARLSRLLNARSRQEWCSIIAGGLGEARPLMALLGPNDRR
jgi:hypothetical protein